MAKRILSIIGKVFIGLIGSWLAILIILELSLSSAVVSKVIKKVSVEYIDGTLDFSKARVSLFKRFPSLYVEIEDFCLTYPSDRFDAQEQAGAQGWLLHQGCGEQADTLASFKSFRTSVRLFSLMQGRINIPYMNLDKPRIFAHYYDKDNANWNIFKLEESTEEEDTTSSELPPFSLGKISLTSHPHIVYTDSKDTLFALLRFNKFDFKGRIANRRVSHNRIALEIDSLIAAGRMASDTIAFGLQTMKIGENGKSIDIHADARTTLATEALGRLDVPIRLDGSVSFPEDSVFAVDINHFNADIATIPIDLNGNLRFYDEKIYVKADANIERCNINGLLKGLAKNIVPDADKISTDALLTLRVKCDGDYIYEPQKLPEMEVSVEVPQSRISHTALSEDISLALNLGANVDKAGKINAQVNKTDISASGLGLNLSGKGMDLLGKDPKLSVKGSMVAILEDLSKFLPDSLGIKTSGSIMAEIEGDALMSQLNLYRFSEARLTGELQGRDLNVQMPADQIDAHIENLNIQLGPENQKSRRDTTVTNRVLALRGQVDSLNIMYGNIKARGNDLSITAKSAADAFKGDKNFHHVGGRFTAGKILADDGNGSRLFIKETGNSFQVSPDPENAKIPILTFTSRNKSIAVKSGVQRAGLKDATIIASATLNKIARAPRSRVRNNRSNTIPQAGSPEDDFKNQDIDIKLDAELAKYFRAWNFRGSMRIDGGYIASPYFPLRNRLNGFKGRFTSNDITINEFSISSGKSDINADGKLSGLRRMLAGGRGGVLDLNLNVNSDNIDVDELMRAYTAGSKFDEFKSKKDLEKISDEDYAEAIVVDTTTAASVPMGTVVIPGNINATLKLNTKNIKYTGLQIDSLKATAIVKDRCIQITDTEAKSNVGDISFDGFYASRSKKDLKAGFSVDFKDITAEKVISLMPAIDTLMPILKSFEGMLNCEIAATTQLDTNMNLMMPSINGILRITGDDLAVKNSDIFKKLAKKLLFKNKKEGHIDHMSVEGVISDNVVEVFPFVLTMDRYTLALSGIQNLDMSFKYHVSLIKSPFLIRLGLDIFGDDFDNMKFRIGRPKYKNPNVPVFSKVIDDTKINLVSSIENIFKKGVDAVIKEHNEVDLIRKHKKEINYVRAVDQPIEELSEEDKKKMEEEEAKQEAEEAAEQAGAQQAEATTVTEKPE